MSIRRPALLSLIALVCLTTPLFGQRVTVNNTNDGLPVTVNNVNDGLPVNVNDINDTPGATLLMPYFQVDLSDTNGWTTVMSVNNASATAILAHVIIWSDLSVPVYNFNVYLTGYDAQAIDMRAVLGGALPQTASAGQDPGDTISPKGSLSQDINFSSCTGQLPPAPLSAATIAHLQNSLTGNFSSLSGGCAGQTFGDNIARGYVTVDTVTNCTLKNPADVGYFGAGGTGDVTNQNVLWGDFYYINRNTNQARGNALIHIHANSTDPSTSTAGRYTFYGRYDGWNAADNRGPLATTFAARYVNNVAFFPDGTELVVWRDPKVNQGYFTCGNAPSWYQLGQEGIAIFDEQEHIAIPPPFFPPPPPLIPFPAATQTVKVNGPSLPVPFNRGWLFLDLNATVAAAGSNPPFDPAASQAIVVTIFNNVGHYSVGYRTTQLDSATNATHFFPH